MFRPNETHRQQDFFGLETQMSPKMLKRLRETKEYAFYEEVFCRIPESLFAELYSEAPASRPNAPINTMVAALILQHLYSWTFEEMLDRIAFDVKVRAALGLWSLGEEPFCRATLFNFQVRLRDHMVATGQDKFRDVFDRLTADTQERFGIKGEIQRCDSTQIGVNIRQYTRIELLVEVVLRMWRVLSEDDQVAHADRFADFVKARTAGQFLYRLNKKDIDPVLGRLGEIYAWMVQALESGYGTTEIYRVVCRIFTEHFTCVEEKVAVRAATEVGSDSLQSPDDPEATYRKKNGEGFHGYVLHACETADPENPFQVITDVAVAPNNVEDGEILHERLPEMHRKTPELRELHTDGGYGNEANDQLQAQLGIQAVQSAICGRSPRAPMHIGNDEAGHPHIRCAAGVSVSGQRTAKQFKAEFAAFNCAGCPFASVCPGELRSHGGRTFYFTEADVLRQARHRRLRELPPERRSLRPNVEATMKQFRFRLGNGKLRTRRHHTASRYGSLRAIAINFGRTYRHLRRQARVSVPYTGSRGPRSRSPRPLTGLLAALWQLVQARLWFASPSRRPSIAFS